MMSSEQKDSHTKLWKEVQGDPHVAEQNSRGRINRIYQTRKLVKDVEALKLKKNIYTTETKVTGTDCRVATLVEVLECSAQSSDFNLVHVEDNKI